MFFFIFFFIFFLVWSIIGMILGFLLKLIFHVLPIKTILTLCILGILGYGLYMLGFIYYK